MKANSTNPENNLKTTEFLASPPKRDSQSSYEIIRKIGEGGMGRVMYATDKSLDRPTALKFVHLGASSNPAFLERFRREARIAARLDHPNIVRIYNFHEEGPEPCIAMEYVEGKNLGQILKEKGPFKLNEAFYIVRQVACALEHAAAQNLIHRDIKPTNIVLTNDNKVKVMDFGLVKALDQVGDDSLTEAGNVLGTPQYMSPEQACGGILDQRSDIYSLGLTLFSLLSGKRPWEETTSAGVLYKQVNEDLPIPQSWKVQFGDNLINLLTWMTAKDPSSRPSDWRELNKELDRLMETNKKPSTLGPTIKHLDLSFVTRPTPQVKKSIRFQIPKAFAIILIVVAITTTSLPILYALGRDILASEKIEFDHTVKSTVSPESSTIERDQDTIQPVTPIIAAINDQTGVAINRWAIASHALESGDLERAKIELIQLRDSVTMLPPMKNAVDTVIVSLDSVVPFMNDIKRDRNINNLDEQTHVAKEIIQESLSDPGEHTWNAIKFLFLINDPQAQEIMDYVAENAERFNPNSNTYKTLLVLSRFHGEIMTRQINSDITVRSGIAGRLRDRLQ